MPMQPQEFDDAKLLWKMFYAGQFFKHAHRRRQNARRSTNLLEQN